MTNILIYSYLAISLIFFIRLHTLTYNMRSKHLQQMFDNYKTFYLFVVALLWPIALIKLLSRS